MDIKSQQTIQRAFELVETVFKEGAKITIVVRNPEYGHNGSADAVFTSDSKEEIIKCINQHVRQNKENDS